MSALVAGALVVNVVDTLAAALPPLPPELTHVTALREQLGLVRCKLKPFAHQVVGIEALVNKPIFALFDEPGAGKTLQEIVSAQILFHRNALDRVIVICPASVRNVWADPELGELAKHLWDETPAIVTEYHARVRQWAHGPTEAQRQLRWVITNYDFIRSDARLSELLPLCGPRTQLVLDESSAVKNHRALQTKACWELRVRCGRVLLLNGTPIANNPGDMYSQGHLLTPDILRCKTYFHFRSRYAVLGGWQQKQIIDWQHLDDLQARFAPYVMRRLKADCLDLPAKLDSVVLTATLTSTTWGVYREMRDELIALLGDDKVSVAAQAIVKIIRLAQITAGFLGGVEEQILDGDLDAPPAYLREEQVHQAGVGTYAVEVIGREKLDVFLGWLVEQLAADPQLKLLVWCRFRPEVARLVHELEKLMNEVPALQLGQIIGGQKRAEREQALRLLDPRTAPPGPVVVVGTPASGSMGLNLTAAHTVIYLSNDYSLKTRLQSEDRVHRPGQHHAVSYYDVVAVGPHGQKTIDHAVMKAIRKKEDLANWTTQAWLTALQA